MDVLKSTSFKMTTINYLNSEYPPCYRWYFSVNMELNCIVGNTKRHWDIMPIYNLWSQDFPQWKRELISLIEGS